LGDFVTRRWNRNSYFANFGADAKVAKEATPNPPMLVLDENGTPVPLVGFCGNGGLANM
jgi:isoleucyl-tRNA synthetase